MEADDLASVSPGDGLSRFQRPIGLGLFNELFFPCFYERGKDAELEMLENIMEDFSCIARRHASVAERHRRSRP